jgi:hypothetical protein
MSIRMFYITHDFFGFDEGVIFSLPIFTIFTFFDADQRGLEVQPNAEVDVASEWRPEVSLSIISTTFFASFPFCLRRQNPFCSRFLTLFHWCRTKSTSRCEVILTFIPFTHSLSLFSPPPSTPPPVVT